MLPKKSCPLWRKKVDSNPTRDREVDLWTRTYMSRITQRLSRMLSLPNMTLPLQPAHILTMINICAFMVTVFSDLESPWCRVFKPEEVELLEYFDDMGHWWDLSYGTAINEVIGCALMTDVVEAVKEVGVVGKRYKKGIFRFGHAETNVFLMSLMVRLLSSHWLVAMNPGTIHPCSLIRSGFI